MLIPHLCSYYSSQVPRGDPSASAEGQAPVLEAGMKTAISFIAAFKKLII